MDQFFTDLEIPSSLETRIQTSNLDNVLQQTRRAVTSNAKILERFCTRVDELEKRLISVEELTVKEMEIVKTKAAQAIASSQLALQETKRLTEESVTKEEFNREREKWEMRISRLEEVNRELLDGKKYVDQDEETSHVNEHREDKEQENSKNGEGDATAKSFALPCHDSSAYGPLGSFVSNLIQLQTKKPMRSLYDQVTQEWDAAFTTISDEAFREINHTQSDLRQFELRSLRFIEETKRQSMQLTRESSMDSACLLQKAVDFIMRHTNATIDEAGFAVRHEVSSMLFQTKKQVALLQRAITRLRNTLCLGPDTETIENITAGSLVRELSNVAGFQRQQQQANVLQRQRSLMVVADASKLKNNNDEEKEASAIVDFGQHRPKRRSKNKKNKRKSKRSGVENNNDEKSSDSSSSSSSSSSCSSSSSSSSSEVEEQENSEDEQDDDSIAQNASLLLPMDFMTEAKQKSSPSKKTKKSSDENDGEKKKDKKKKKKHHHHHHHARHHHHHKNDHKNNFMMMGAASPFDALLMMGGDPNSIVGGGGGGGFQSQIHHTHNHPASSSSPPPSDVDIRSILNTPIFSTLRNLIEESARNEIDAHNTIRETQYTTEMEDLRQAVMRKVNMETVQRLIARGKDRKAQEQLDYCVKSIGELHSTVLKEHEWKALLKSKADFSEIDAVRVHCSSRIQGLDDAVQRMERALVVGFGESLNIAPPKTFEQLEVNRVEAEMERRRLFLERGSIDDTLIVSKQENVIHNNNIHSNNNNLEKELMKTPKRPDVQDARSVVVGQSRRDVLIHSAPPSRPNHNNNNNNNSLNQNQQQQNHAKVVIPNSNSTLLGRPHSATTAINSSSSPTSMNSGKTSSPIQNHQLQQRPQTAQSNHTNAASVATSSGSANTAATVVITSQLPKQTPTPPRHDLIYSSTSTSAPHVLAATALATMRSSMNSSSNNNPFVRNSGQQFTDALKSRCNLDDDAAKKW